MVKPLKMEDTPFADKNGKFEALAKDVKEIVDKQIEYCELVDLPYAASTAITDLQRKCNKVCDLLCVSITNKGCAGKNFFRVSKTNDKDGKVHFYLKFDVNEWNKTIGKGE